MHLASYRLTNCLGLSNQALVRVDTYDPELYQMTWTLQLPDQTLVSENVIQSIEEAIASTCPPCQPRISDVRSSEERCVYTLNPGKV